MTGLVLACLLLGSDVEDEHAELAQRLEAEKSAFEALGAEKKSLLTLLDTMERLARESAARSVDLEKNLARLARQSAELRADEAVVREAMSEQEHRLGPRLLTMYRLQRSDSLGMLLSAGDFATLVKRQRALKTLVESDARALEEIAVVARYQRLQSRRLERLDATAQRYLRALRSEQAVGRARLARFQDLLTSVGAEQNTRSRVIAELEASEKELASMVAEMQSANGSTGFRARKGRLPYPAQGVVEVGFGKVVNPRFNTVTVQKGIDLRAPAGTEVVSVGVGTVVFASWLKGYGNLVIVDHGAGYHSLYAHLASTAVEVGNEVEEGETIGTVGDTGSLKGAFLYFEVRKQGQAVDPLPWLTTEGQ